MLRADETIRPLDKTVPGILRDLEEVWVEARGDARVCVAVLDGPVDRAHPSLPGLISRCWRPWCQAHLTEDRLATTAPMWPASK
jgi:hypothetical protein